MVIPKWKQDMLDDADVVEDKTPKVPKSAKIKRPFGKIRKVK